MNIDFYTEKYNIKINTYTIYNFTSNGYAQSTKQSTKIMDLIIYLFIFNIDLLSSIPWVIHKKNNKLLTTNKVVY